MKDKMNRREFLKTSSLAVAGLSAASMLPTIDTKGAVIGANDRVRVGFIGAGNRGTQLLKSFMKLPDVQIAALCDVYEPYVTRNADAVDPRFRVPHRRPVPAMNEGLGKEVARYKDYRKMLGDSNIDAVCISTPDHWHALQAIDSMQAGKDVYLEKPVSMTIAEGRRIVEVAAETKKVVSVGYVRRISKLYNMIPDILRSGKIGEISMISSQYHSNMTPNGIGRMKPEAPPADFDWDMWLGPRAERPFQYNLAPYMFRWFKEYSSQIANNGSHFIDIVNWLTGESAPVAVTAIGTNHIIRDDRTIPEDIDIIYEFASGRLFRFRFSETTSMPGLEYGYIQFAGTKGSLYLGDEGYKILPGRAGQFQQWGVPFEAEEFTMKREDWTTNHVADFIRCVKTRETPVSPIEQCFRSSSFALLANIALEVKQRIEWDPVAERVTNCDRANELLSYAYRAPWKLG